MAICILVFEDEGKAYELWDLIKKEDSQISNFEIIEPTVKEKKISKNGQISKNFGSLKKVKITNVKLFNPEISRKERQKKMSTWLMPFGFIARLTFDGMTNLNTFSNLGFSKASEPFIGGLVGMGSGWIGSFFGARSVNTSKEDLKSLFKRNEQGFWLILLEPPLEIELPWGAINQTNPIETVNLNLM